MKEYFTSLGNSVAISLTPWVTVIFISVVAGFALGCILLVLFLRAIKKGAPIHEVETPAHWIEDAKE
jgi:hypothetical protein